MPDPTSDHPYAGQTEDGSNMADGHDSSTSYEQDLSHDDGSAGFGDHDMAG